MAKSRRNGPRPLDTLLFVPIVVACVWFSLVWIALSPLRRAIFGPHLDGYLRRNAENWFAERNPGLDPKHEQARLDLIELLLDAVAALLPKGGKLYFTSGATEAINWALRCIDSELALTGNALPREVRDRIAQLGTGPEPFSIRVSTKLPSGLSQPIYPGFVDEELKRQTEYDFQLFKNQLRRISESLAKT